MDTDFYLNSDTGNDGNAGTSWATAKKHLYAITPLINDVIVAPTTIHFAATSTPYDGDAMLAGVRCIGEDAALYLEPDTEAGTIIWNEANYDGAVFDPFAPGETGTFDIKGDKEVTYNGSLTIRDSRGVEIRGLRFLSSGDTSSLVMITNGSLVTAKYCLFEGDESMLSALTSQVVSENNYFKGNGMALAVGLGALLRLLGDNYIEDPKLMGILASGRSHVHIGPWTLHPRDFFTTEIKTTKPTLKDFIGIKLALDSLLVVQDDDILPIFVNIGRLAIRNLRQMLPAKYYGILLESASKVMGLDNISFTTYNSKGEEVDMPEAHTIVTRPKANGTVSA
jgi:hypothetical protein